VRACGTVLCSFDGEVAQFLRACLELVDIRSELPSYSAVWAVMKVGLLPLLLQLRLRELMLELGDGPATIGHPRCQRVTMAMQDLVEGAGSCLCIDSVLQQPWGVIYAIVFEYLTRNCFRNSILAGLFYIQPLSA